MARVKSIVPFEESSTAFREHKEPRIVAKNVCRHVLITVLNISLALMLVTIF